MLCKTCPSIIFEIFVKYLIHDIRPFYQFQFFNGTDVTFLMALSLEKKAINCMDMLH